MSIQIEGKTYYSPKETANVLGISVGMLRYHRNEGNIEGLDMQTTTYYSQEQIDAANLERKKPGPKSVQKPNEDDKQGGRDTTVMFKRSIRAEALIGAAS
jgi:hypothetical protein